jgi:hypothetical protein
VLVEGAQKKFKEYFGSKRALVRHLVMDRKLIPPDQVCRELAPFLPAIEAAASAIAPADEAAKTAPPIASADGGAQPASPVAPSGEAVTRADEAAEAAAPIASADGAAEAVPPRARAGKVHMDMASLTELINWVEARGSQGYPAGSGSPTLTASAEEPK